MSPAPAEPMERPIAPWRIVAATALVYAVVGLIALRLALPPGYASPLYPSAGIALAATLVHGRWGALGAMLGAFTVNAGLSAMRGQTDVIAWLVPMGVALGAAAQATLGAALVRRHVSAPLLLDQPRDIARFFLVGGPIACLVNATLAVSMLVAAGSVAPGEALENAWTWWVGDTLGVLIGAPVALALIGHPRAAWAARRRSVALPLAIVTALMAAASLAVARWDEERLAARFTEEASALAGEVETRMREPLFALQAMRSVFLVHGGFDEAALRDASRWWLAQPMSLQAIGYSVRVPRGGVAAFEAGVRATGNERFRIFDRDAALAAADDEVVVIRLIEPLDSNAGALGVNALSIGAARQAIERARASGQPAATAGFGLTQSDRDETGLVVYQALYDPPAPGVTAAPFHGVVFVTLRPERILADLVPPGSAQLRWCLLDLDPASDRPRLAGPAGCESAAPARLEIRRPLAFAGRSLELRIGGGDVAGVLTRPNAWLFSIAGLAGAALLGALLLVLSGRTRRIEAAVAERTAALSAEIGERRAAEEALRDSEARLRSILDHVPIGVMFLDLDGRLLEVNPRLCEMLGRPAGVLRQLTIADITHPDDHAEHRRLRRELLEGRLAGVDLRLRVRRSGGDYFWARLHVGLLRGPGGEPRRMAAVLEDITEHLRLEESERARDRAEAASRTKSEFVSRMSHELRTPLNAMIGFAQLLGMDQAPALSQTQREWAQQIQRAGWHLLEMINETLDLARIESGALQMALRPLALAPLIESSLVMVGANARARGIALDSQLAADASWVMADETRLTQILTNLLTNAVKYNRDGGTVQIRTRRDGDEIVVAVRDSGLGMSSEQIAGLFQPYNRLGREHTAIEGTGIGLVISRRLAELMGGTLDVESEPGRGSEFTLWLPAAAPAEPDAATSQHPTEDANYRRRIVHYIEDNDTNVEVMRGILTQRPQIELGVSTLGLDGLAAVRRSRPDLVLLDMQLPDISGIELLRHLKQDDDTAAIPVIVVSADATTARIQDALTLGAAHYVTKPVQVGRFLQTIDGILEGAETRWG